MARKERIIVDGIDVTECGNRFICHLDDGLVYCKINPFCYYKQLARKTQECEELKSEVKELFNAKLELLRELDHYKRAYYGCQKPAKEKFVAPIPLPPAEFVDACYLKALEEIEKISHYGTFKCVDCAGFNCKACTKEQFERVLNIINKAKGDNNER